MSFSRPSFSELIARVRADVQSGMSPDELLRRSDALVLSDALAGAAHGLYGYLDWAVKQIFPDQADADQLDRHGSLWGLTRNSAAAATGNATFSGVIGSVVPVGTLLQRSDGVQFKTTAEVAVGVTNSVAAAVTATTTGQSTSTATGVSLSLVNPVAGVTSSAVVASGGLTGGADAESDADYRARILSRLRQPPMGGAKSDYVAWALQVSGVTRAWSLPNWLGAGTVGVLFVRDDDSSIIPDAGEVAAVQTYIDTVRPVTASVTVMAPVGDTLNFSIQLTPSSTAIRAAVEAEIRDMLLRDAYPGCTIYLSRINEAISIATGETDHVLASPSANQVYSTTHMPIFGAITWL